MKSASKFALVLVTAPDLKIARLLAQAALQPRLAACVNLVPAIESHYWWQGKLSRNSEVLLFIKTTKTCLAALEKTIKEKHPYDTPEFVVAALESGTTRYLEWLARSVKAGR